jgi:hypothetical protein
LLSDPSRSTSPYFSFLLLFHSFAQKLTLKQRLARAYKEQKLGIKLTDDSRLLLETATQQQQQQQQQQREEAKVWLRVNFPVCSVLIYVRLVCLSEQIER